MTKYVGNTKNTMWFTQPILRARGWTDSGIRKFLPPPEGFKQNFNYAGHPMPVWSPETVAKAEGTEEWQTWLELSLSRRKTTLAAISSPVDISKEWDEKLERAQSFIDGVDKLDLVE